MAQTSLVSYLHNVSICINDKDGVGLAECVSFKHPHVSNPRLRLEQPEADVQRMIDPPWDELVAGHLRACWAISVEDYIEAYTTQTYALQAILKVIQQQKDENWQLPVMYDVILDLRYFANLADKQQRKKSVGRPGDVLEKAAEQIMGCFRACVTDTRAEIRVSKRWAMLPITNQLLKIYFKINKLHLCKPLITAIENSDLRDHFSSAQQVTFRYFVGRKAMFDGDYRTADEYLSYAFSQCHRFSKNNKRRILTYLLPVKMLLGYMPKVALLHKYDLMQFADVANAVRTGNLLQFNEALSQHEGFFIRCGVYLILEKLKIHTYRNLFKKVYLIMKTHQLPIDIFVDALTLMKEVDIDNDECQCILANLIYENRIKGYISHQHNKLVVSKQNPFPSLVNQ